MIKDFIEKSLASFYNKCRQTKGTYEGTDFALSGLLTVLIFATFLLSLSFFEEIFGWPLHLGIITCFLQRFQRQCLFLLYAVL